MKTKEEIKDLLLEEEKKGNIVFNTFEGLMSMKLDDIIDQPTEGLLYDLNRDKATIFSNMGTDNYNKWINDYAVALVITRLKEHYFRLKGLEK